MAGNTALLSSIPTFRGYVLKESTENDLIDAINGRKVCVITYTKNGAVGSRTIEPVSLGTAFNGGLYLRAWQREGNSESFDSKRHKKNDPLTKVPGYRMFNVDYITSLEITDEVYRTDKAFLRSKRPKHNKYFNREDKDMDRIIASVMLDTNISVDFIFNGVIDKLMSNPSISQKDKGIIDSLEASDYTDTVKNLKSWERYTDRKTKEMDILAFVANKIGKKLKK